MKYFYCVKMKEAAVSIVLSKQTKQKKQKLWETYFMLLQWYWLFYG